MGMAASQARYLALVARQSNCEYEGQQINQARLLLSNQSANLFNQMLGLSVPVPPSTQDYTKTQYSYSDGVNSSVIDSWKQLSNDPEYNYVVTSHYYTDVYTGSVKKMTDPQVQVSNESGAASLGSWSAIQSAYSALTAAQAVRDSSYDTWQTTKASQERVINSIKRQAVQNNNKYEMTAELTTCGSQTPGPGYTQYSFSDSSSIYYIKIYNDPGAISDTTVAGWNTSMTNALGDSNLYNGAVQGASTLNPTAENNAISAAQKAFEAAQCALEIANRSGDALAIAQAEADVATAQTALEKANDYSAYYAAEYTDVFNGFLNEIFYDITYVTGQSSYSSQVGERALNCANKALEAAIFAKDWLANNVDPSDPSYSIWEPTLNNYITQATTLEADVQNAVDLSDLTTLQNLLRNAPPNTIYDLCNNIDALVSDSTFTYAAQLGYVKNISGSAYNAACDASNLITSDIFSAARANSPEYDEAKSILEAIRDQVELGIMSIDDVNAAITEYYASNPLLGEPILITNIDDLLDYSGMPTFSDIQKEVLNTFGIATHTVGSDTFTDIVKTAEIEALHDEDWSDPSVQYTLYGYPLNGENTVTTNAEYLAQIADAQLLIDNDFNTYETAQSIYENALNAYNALNRPTYIGNSELTLLGTLTEDQKTELLQVVKDLRAQGITSHILDCFDMDGTYLGGVYSFKLNGNTYYTTYDDLNDAYASNIYSNNYIDAQYKMPYYNASYISTKIEQEGKALLETDGSGRFTSIRFENDSVTYSLNMETVTDDEAYQDAMNRYYYENAKYDKMIQDINAKTSLIQQEDQELELRLKQLDTERNALKTEAEAVQKVVKDNVEASFKTFGG